MGEYADEMIQRQIDVPRNLFKPIKVVNTFNDPMWRQTKVHRQHNGNLVRLEDMNPRWRGNTIRLWERACANAEGRLLLHEQPLVKRMIELGVE